MTLYGKMTNDLTTPQTEQAHKDQRQNNAGGFSFVLDKWMRLDRFLVLGAEGGTYYVDEKKHVQKNVACLRECLAEDGPRTVARIVEISDSGRAPKNDPAIFALAMAAGAKDKATRSAALAALPKVCRIGTHLFHFAADVEGFRRWGRSLRTAVGKWYTGRSDQSLAMQVIKYQQRDGWSNRDLLRLSHPKPRTDAQRAIFRWVALGAEEMAVETRKRGTPISREKLPAIIEAFEEIHDSATSPHRAADLIREFRLPHECVPNEFKDRPDVWAALLENMGQTALIRNLGKMTSIGLLKPMSDSTKKVAAQLTDRAQLKAGRVHPLTVLLALKTYASGRGIKGSLTWSPVPQIVDALDDAFYAAFEVIEPTGKNILMGLDVSGSMGWGNIAGTCLKPSEAAAAMAMVTARSEKSYHIMGFADTFRDLGISARQRLDDVVRKTSGLTFGGTDCALPMLYAAEKKLEVDAFVVLTDNETWAGLTGHPHQALQSYRQKMGRPAKSVVVGMTASEFTIADPNDGGMLDVVGFDSAAPGVIADFIRG